MPNCPKRISEGRMNGEYTRENETSFLWGCQKQTRSRLKIHEQAKVDYIIHINKMGRATGPQAPASPAQQWF